EEEVLSLQSLGEGGGREGARRQALERVAPELEALRKGAQPCGTPPPFGIPDNRLSYACRRLGARVPDATARKDLPGADVEVVAGCVSIACALLAERHQEGGRVRA